jgi:transposase-like protein
MRQTQPNTDRRCITSLDRREGEMNGTQGRFDDTGTDAAIELGQPSSSVEQKARRSPRRMLSEDQKREVVRLYAETITPLEEIRRHFGIAESSLYRLIQQRGVPPRGRVAVVNRVGVEVRAQVDCVER